MMVDSLPRWLRCRRVPKTSAILWAVSRHRPSSQLSLEQLVDRKVAFEDVVEAILNLTDGIGTRQLDLTPLFGGELRAEDGGPIIEPLTDDFRAQHIGGGLQCGDIVNSQKRVVILAEADVRLVELVLDEAVAVEVVGCLEREE